jgi:hypothetical protein
VSFHYKNEETWRAEEKKRAEDLENQWQQKRRQLQEEERVIVQEREV